MIDLHTHVLPGIDDGPDDLPATLAMVRAAARAGTEVLVATPHVREDHPRVRPQDVPTRVRRLQEELRREGLDMRVLPGGELALSAMVDLSDADLRSITLGGSGRYLLVETPFGGLPSLFEELVGGLQHRGFDVILAHPEHSRTFQEHPERLHAVVARGVMLQLTAASFAAPAKSRSGKLARALLGEGFGHVIASDAHSAWWRPPDLNPGLQAARETVPAAASELDWMVRDVPGAIVEGRDIPPRPPRPEVRRRGWQDVLRLKG